MKLILFSVALSGLAAAVAATPVAEPANRPYACPVNGTLPPNYVIPNIIINISKQSPNTASGATRYPLITPNDFGSILSFDLPPSAYNKICKLVFLFPDHSQTVNPFTYAGPGHFSFKSYAVGAKPDAKKTTYNNQPPPAPFSPTPPPVIKPGNAYTLSSEPCGFPPGLTNPVTVAGLISSSDTTFKFYESDQPCPLGLFVELLDQA